MQQSILVNSLPEFGLYVCVCGGWGGSYCTESLETKFRDIFLSRNRLCHQQVEVAHVPTLWVLSLLLMGPEPPPLQAGLPDL